MNPSWWLSFADPDGPENGKFLGACIVGAADFSAAVAKAWDLRLNPGGEVAGGQIPAGKVPLIAAKWRGRLLTWAECEQFDEEMAVLIAAAKD